MLQPRDRKRHMLWLLACIMVLARVMSLARVMVLARIMVLARVMFLSRVMVLARIRLLVVSIQTCFGCEKLQISGIIIQ